MILSEPDHSARNPKGGLKRPDDAKPHLGIALLRAGQKGRAAQVLKTVGGADGTADLARLWMRVP